MSTLRVNTISNAGGTQSTAIENAINGSAKAWVNFNGTGVVAIRAQYNVSSITDNGAGDYTVNFTTAMADTNYSVTATVRLQGISNSGAPDPFTYSTSSIRTRCVNSSGTAFDTTEYNLAVFR